MISETYQKEVTVLQEHIDRHQHVNNVIFLKWVQDISGEHWLSNADPVFDAQHYWVVLNHFIEYKGEALLGDVLTIKTYVVENVGPKSTRTVEFYKGDKLIVQSKTTWCLINRERNRPTRIPDEVHQLFFNTIDHDS